MTLALGDALAMTVMRQKGFTRTDFGRLHPGRLARRAAEAGAAADARRRVAAADPRRTARCTTRWSRCPPSGSASIGVTDDDGYLVGVITDGDLRRNIERGLDHTAAEFMTRDPKTIAPDALVDDALTLFDEYRITALFVVEDDGGQEAGRRAPHPRLPAGAMNTVILIPARYAVVALSRESRWSN